MGKQLEEAKEENARLKAAVAKHEDDLRVLGEHSVVMECEASDSSKARDRAKAELATMFEEFEGMRARHLALQDSHAALQAEHAELQEEHSILKEELSQLEEKHAETLEHLQVSKAFAEKVSEGKLIAEEKHKYFRDENRKLSLQLKTIQAAADNYLHQLSFASRVRDAA